MHKLASSRTSPGDVICLFFQEKKSHCHHRDDTSPSVQWANGKRSHLGKLGASPSFSPCRCAEHYKLQHLQRRFITHWDRLTELKLKKQRRKDCYCEVREGKSLKYFFWNVAYSAVMFCLPSQAMCRLCLGLETEWVLSHRGQLPFVKLNDLFL